MTVPDFCPGVLFVTNPFELTLNNIWQEEWQWIESSVIAPLNAEIRNAAEAHNWKFVEGMSEYSRDHGACTADRFVNTFEDSDYRQGDFGGVAHPNQRAHTVYGYIVADSLADALGLDYGIAPRIVDEFYCTDATCPIVLGGGITPTHPTETYGQQNFFSHLVLSRTSREVEAFIEWSLSSDPQTSALLLGERIDYDRRIEFAAAIPRPNCPGSQIDYRWYIRHRIDSTAPWEEMRSRVRRSFCTNRMIVR